MVHDRRIYAVPLEPQGPWVVPLKPLGARGVEGQGQVMRRTAQVKYINSLPAGGLLLDPVAASEGVA